MQPLCFVLMPFGRKPGQGGTLIDFDAVYAQLIAPAIRAAGMEPLRADEELDGGIIHKPMFERLILCPHAVADLTTANANVFYELGVRHGVRPGSTTLIFAQTGGPLPFDVGLLRGVPYQLGADGKPADIEATKNSLATRIERARDAVTDSPVYELVEGFPDIQRLKTDVFRDRVAYSHAIKEQLHAARKMADPLDASGAIDAVVAGLGRLEDADAGVVVDAFLSYRAVKAWGRMIQLVSGMSKPLAQSTMVQEQLGLALNRNGQPEEAERVLKQVVARQGPSSETCGLLGRVYKDRWEAAAKAGDRFMAKAMLGKAIGAYLQGFETDWRDAYPGVNAVTLMELAEPPDPRQKQILPVVSYAVQRRIAAGKPDYWDHATQLELAVLGRNRTAAEEALGESLAAVREAFEPETTARNLRLIREARERRMEADPWAHDLESALDQAR